MLGATQKSRYVGTEHYIIPFKVLTIWCHQDHEREAKLSGLESVSIDIPSFIRGRHQGTLFVEPKQAGLLSEWVSLFSIDSIISYREKSDTPSFVVYNPEGEPVYTAYSNFFCFQILYQDRILRFFADNRTSLQISHLMDQCLDLFYQPSFIYRMLFKEGVYSGGPTFYGHFFLNKDTPALNLIGLEYLTRGITIDDTYTGTPLLSFSKSGGNIALLGGIEGFLSKSLQAMVPLTLEVGATPLFRLPEIHPESEPISVKILLEDSSYYTCPYLEFYSRIQKLHSVDISRCMFLLTDTWACVRAFAHNFILGKLKFY